MKFALILSAFLCGLVLFSCGEQQRDRMDSEPRNTPEIPSQKSRHQKGPQQSPPEAIPADGKPAPATRGKRVRTAIDTLRPMTA